MLTVSRHPNGPVHYVVVLPPFLVGTGDHLAEEEGEQHSDLAYLDILTTNIWPKLVKGWIVLSTG